jgi:hypothetical protein
VDSGVLVSTIEISMMTFSPPQLPPLLTEAEQLGPLLELLNLLLTRLRPVTWLGLLVQLSHMGQAGPN